MDETIYLYKEIIKDLAVLVVALVLELVGFCAIIFLIISLIFFVLSYIKPNCFYLLNKAWNKFGFFLSKIFNVIFLFLCYCLIIIPTSFFMKLLFRYDSMNLKRKETLWADRNKKSYVSNLKDQF